MLAGSCSKDYNNEEPIIDPNDPKVLILGEWLQHQSAQYREGQTFKDTSINKYSPPDYYRFTKDQFINGYQKNGIVVFQDYGNPYLIKGDSILSPFRGVMTFAGDSLMIESRAVISGIKTYNIEVLYRY